jgi:NDP-4-keto-2,6-dideoxyhexose 3-C-methyltransferase
MLYTTRETCRLCDGPLVDVLSLGDIHLSTFLDTNDNPPPKVPLDLVMCDTCTLLQLRHTVSSDAMYSDYWYQSGLNKAMIIALADVVNEVHKRINLRAGDLVVDIGANDGTLLQNYDNDLVRIGFEPSNLHSLGRDKCDIMINDYFNKRAYIDHLGVNKARVITAIAMFYDLEYPHEFVQDLKEVLADDGIIVIQMMDLMSMLKLGDFPNICHEHLEYYSLGVLIELMEEHGLQVFDVTYNGVNGGSMRAYIRHDTGEAAPQRVINAEQREYDYLNSIDIPLYFRQKIELVRSKIVSFIRQKNEQGCTIAVLGASTKGNTILQYFGLTDKHIIHAAEVNPDKYGKRTVGSNIPIIPEKESLESNPDFYLVLPWGFIDTFVSSFRDYLEKDGIFIVPLPEPRLITRDKEAICTIKL